MTLLNIAVMKPGLELIKCMGNETPVMFCSPAMPMGATYQAKSRGTTCTSTSSKLWSARRYTFLSRSPAIFSPTQWTLSRE